MSAAAFQAGAGINCADVSVADFPRLTGETGDSARIMRAVEAAEKGGVVWFPRGEYEIDAMLVVSNSASLLMHKSAHLKAVREMPFVLKYFGRLMEAGNADSSGIVDHNLFIKGGDIEKEAYTGDGEMVNSGFLNGIQTKKEAIETEYTPRKKTAVLNEDSGT